MIEFYRMNLVDIIEVEDSNGKVIFRGHNPDFSGDIKIDQKIIKEGLSGKISLSYEHGHSGFAIRAVAPVFSGDRVIGLFMAGSLFSREFVQRMKSLTLLDNGIYRDNRKLISTYSGKEFLSDILDGVLNLCTYSIKDRNIRLVKNYDTDAPLFRADPEKLRICFLNIILNAIQIMEEGGTLAVSTGFDGMIYEIRICNTGSFIDPEDADKLFIPFYTTREGGTGLGISISKLIVERHGGSISVYTEMKKTVSVFC